MTLGAGSSHSLEGFSVHPPSNRWKGKAVSEFQLECQETRSDLGGRFTVVWGFLGGSEVKAFACNVGDPGSIPGLGRCPGEGNGNPLQYSCLENPMEGGAWWATVHRVTKSRI